MLSECRTKPKLMFPLSLRCHLSKSFAFSVLCNFIHVQKEGLSALATTPRQNPSNISEWVSLVPLVPSGIL